MRAALIVGFVVAVFVGGNLELRATPPSAAAWSFPLTLATDPSSGLFESDPLRVDVTLAGVSWSATAPRAAWVRGSDDGTAWTAWTPLTIDAEHGPDPGTEEARRQRSASEPAYLGEVQWVQFRVDGPSNDIQAEVVETAGRQRSLLERASDLWRRIGWGSDDAGAAPDQPPIIGREVWGGDRCVAGKEDDEPSYTDGVRTMFVHHTATAGAYSEAGAADVVYAICNYHAHTRDWKDIGYNFLIDVYGNIYEGRAGGVDEPVWGAHTGGFNYYSFGVGLIADHNSSPVGTATFDSLVALGAWKLDVHHVDPDSAVTIESLGSTLYEQGVEVSMATVSGHRDASATSCPGDLCYPLLGQFRERFRDVGGVKIFGVGPAVRPVAIGPTTFGFVVTEPVEWVFQVLDTDGAVVMEEAGAGEEISIAWDGTIDGALIEPGDYRVSLTATSESGAQPRPVDETITWYRPPFRDDDASVHEAAIIQIAAEGVTQGCSEYFDWWFCPDAAVPRDQMASFVARALHLEESTEDWFSDDNGNTHEAAINSVAAAGITLGCGDGIYCPARLVTRAEMAAFLARALDLQPVPQDYFTDDNSHPHEAAINAVAEAGITLGCGGERYCPGAPVKRAQMASFLDRAFISGP